METQAAPSGMGTYLYCVIPAPTSAKGGPALRATPIDAGGRAARLRLLRDGDLAAVVSDAPLKDYDPSRANVSAHERVVDEALQGGDVLPVRFGTVAGDEGEVARFLRDKHQDLARSLERVHGRAELGLKVLWNQQRLFAELLGEDANLRGLRDAVSALPEAQSYEQRIELGRLAAEAIERKRDAMAEQIVARLRPFAVDAKVNRLLSDTMVLNAAFLVDRAKIDAFDREVNALGAEQGDRLTFQYVGPLPPYNFVDVSVPKAG